LCVVLVVCVAPVAAQFGNKPTRPQVEPPKGPVRQVIFKNCTSCHGIDDYAYNALDRAGWNALIDTKHQDLTVRIPDKDRDLLLDWVVAKFGPDSRPFPRAYIPPEITTFFSDPFSPVSSWMRVRNRSASAKNSGPSMRAIRTSGVVLRSSDRASRAGSS
jgi:hypothetical protein